MSWTAYFRNLTALSTRPFARRTGGGTNRGQCATSRKLLVEQLEDRNLMSAGWVDSIGGTTGLVADLAGDAAGNTYVTGSFSNQSATFGNITLTGNGVKDFFVAKANADGQYLWAVKADLSSTASLSARIAVDAAGDAFITGYFSGTAQFGTQTLTSAGGSDVFVAKLNGSTGQFLWAQQRGSSAYDRGSAVAVDPSGNVLVSGAFDGPASSSDSPIVFVSKFATDGTELWTNTATGAMTGSMWSVAVDAAGNVYAGGRFHGTAEFPTGTLVSSAYLPSASGIVSCDALLTKLDQDGNWLWARQFIGDTFGMVGRSTVAPGGQLYVSGTFEGIVNFDATSLTSTGKQDVFVAQLNAATGDVSWAQRVGGIGTDNVGGLKVDPQENVNVVGTFWYVGSGDVTADFGPQTLSSEGYGDAFMTKLNPAGTFLESHRLTAGRNSGSVITAGLHIDAAGSLYVGGWIAGGLGEFAQQPVNTASGEGFVTRLPSVAGATKFYVVNDASEDRTYQYAADGNLTLDFFDLPSSNNASRGIASTAVGDKVWVLDANRHVYVYGASGAFLGSWTAGTLATNAAPEGITVSSAGDVWIVDATSDKVFKYTGAASRLSGSQTAASSFSLNKSNNSPKGIVTDGASLWVVNSVGADRVFKYSISGTLLGKWGIDAANSSPTGITVNPASVSDIWIVDNVALKIFKYTAAASRISGSQNAGATYALAAAGNTNPQDIADPPPESQAIAAPPIQLLVPRLEPEHKGLEAQPVHSEAILDGWAWGMAETVVAGWGCLAACLFHDGTIPSGEAHLVASRLPVCRPGPAGPPRARVGRRPAATPPADPGAAPASRRRLRFPRDEGVSCLP